MNIYIGNLAPDTTEDEVKEAFAAFGDVASVKIIRDGATGESRGFGFVEMPNEEQAKAAITEMNGKELKGNQIHVEQGRAKAAAPGFGGGGGRRPGGDRGGPRGGGRPGGRPGGGGGRRIAAAAVVAADIAAARWWSRTRSQRRRWRRRTSLLIKRLRSRTIVGSKPHRCPMPEAGRFDHDATYYMPCRWLVAGGDSRQVGCHLRSFLSAICGIHDRVHPPKTEAGIMPRQSAGLLMYRKRQGQMEVLLIHPGRPLLDPEGSGCVVHPQGRVHGRGPPRRRQTGIPGGDGFHRLRRFPASRNDPTGRRQDSSTPGRSKATATPKRPRATPSRWSTRPVPAGSAHFPRWTGPRGSPCPRPERRSSRASNPCSTSSNRCSADSIPREDAVTASCVCEAGRRSSYRGQPGSPLQGREQPAARSHPARHPFHRPQSLPPRRDSWSTYAWDRPNRCR